LRWAKVTTMYKRILVAVDGSATSKRGLAEAIKLARSGGARLRLLHVVDEVALIAGLPDAVYTQELFDAVRDSGKRVLARALAQAKTRGVRADSRLVENFSRRVADVIVREARKWRADLLVLGTHGRRGVTRMVMGSDAELVVRHAPAPVLLVRAGGRS
jgi:nucleotide-binding universal stress UspA family protein